MNIFAMIAKDSIEWANARIRSFRALYVLDNEDNAAVIASHKRRMEKAAKEGRYSRVHTGVDVAGKTYIMIWRRGVHCPHPPTPEKFPQIARSNGSVIWSIPLAVCKKCEHYRAGGMDRIKHPHCDKMRMERKGKDGALGLFTSTVQGVVDESNKILGR